MVEQDGQYVSLPSVPMRENTALFCFREEEAMPSVFSAILIFLHLYQYRVWTTISTKLDDNGIDILAFEIRN